MYMGEGMKMSTWNMMPLMTCSKAFGLPFADASLAAKAFVNVLVLDSTAYGGRWHVRLTNWCITVN